MFSCKGGESGLPPNGSSEHLGYGGALLDLRREVLSEQIWS